MNWADTQLFRQLYAHLVVNCLCNLQNGPKTVNSVLSPGLPVSALHGPAAAPPAVRRGGARLCGGGHKHPLPAAAAPE